MTLDSRASLILVVIQELSPLVMKTDNSLPVDPMDIEKEANHVEDQLDGKSPKVSI